MCFRDLNFEFGDLKFLAYIKVLIAGLDCTSKKIFLYVSSFISGDFADKLSIPVLLKFEVVL